MLGKTSVSMMVLLVAASLIGISSIYQYIEGQTTTPAPTPRPEQLPTIFVDIKGKIQFIIMFAGGSCSATVAVSPEFANRLGIPGTSIIRLGAADHNICNSFGLARIGGYDITFDAQKRSETGQGSRWFTASRVLV